MLTGFVALASFEVKTLATLCQGATRQRSEESKWYKPSSVEKASFMAEGLVEEINYCCSTKACVDLPNNFDAQKD